jgi:hypothetical protein
LPTLRLLVQQRQNGLDENRCGTKNGSKCVSNFYGEIDALPEAHSEGLELGVRMPFHARTVARP